jgi:lipid-A-disaccharide synthase-like uncharacterized protein
LSLSSRFTIKFLFASLFSAHLILIYLITRKISGDNIVIYIQHYATLHSLFYLQTALRVSGGTITHLQERKQLHLQHLVFVTPLLLPAVNVEELELV